MMPSADRPIRTGILKNDVAKIDDSNRNSVDESLEALLQTWRSAASSSVISK